jgi:hypothetical protein
MEFTGTERLKPVGFSFGSRGRRRRKPGLVPGVPAFESTSSMGRPEPELEGGTRYHGGMNPLLLIIILLLLFGGGGFYWGGPVYGGSAIGLILLICIIMLLMGASGSRK